MRGLEAHRLVIVPRGGPHRPALPAGPGGAQAPPVVSRAPRTAARGPLRYPPAVRVAVLSDIHANLRPSTRCSAAIPSVDEVWQLGDVVGYGPEPDEVVARLRSIGALGVRGNHDAAAVGGLDIDAFNVDARRAMEWTQATIAPDTRAWLAALPERLEREDILARPRQPPRPDLGVRHHDARRARGHGGDADDRTASTATPTSRSRTSRTTAQLQTMSPGAGSRLTFDGRRVLLNPGSVGQPRDGDPDRVLAPARHGRRRGDVAPHRLRRRRRPGGDGGAGLPERLVARLSYGL